MLLFLWKSSFTVDSFCTFEVSDHWEELVTTGRGKLFADWSSYRTGGFTAVTL